MTIFTGRRCTTFVKLPVALSGAIGEKEILPACFGQGQVALQAPAFEERQVQGRADGELARTPVAQLRERQGLRPDAAGEADARIKIGLGRADLRGGFASGSANALPKAAPRSSSSGMAASKLASWARATEVSNPVATPWLRRRSATCRLCAAISLFERATRRSFCTPRSSR